MKALKILFFALAVAMTLGACAEKKEPATIIDTESQECGQSKEGCSDY